MQALLAVTQPQQGSPPKVLEPEQRQEQEQELPY